MNGRVLKLLRCPVCRGPVSLQARGATASETTLSCRECVRVYPVVNGVPRMMATAGGGGEIAQSVGFQWRARDRGWFERSTLFGLSVEEERRDFFNRLGIRPEDLHGKMILDAGCGDGFLLRALADYPAELLGIDINKSIDVAYRCCRDCSNVTVVQADILAPSFCPETFDYVWCEGVLVYTEDPHKAFRALSDFVKPGGRLYVWVYPSERLSAYQRIRDLLRGAHRPPRPLLLAFCYGLAIPLALAQQFLRQRARLESVGTIALGLFDDLSPRIQTRHTVAEIRSWFEILGSRT